MHQLAKWQKRTVSIHPSYDLGYKKNIFAVRNAKEK
jgi:hypothetical protein